MVTIPSDNGDPVRRSRRANLLLLLLSGGLLVLSVAIVANFLTTRSRDAVINAEPIGLRSPIAGTLRDLRVRAGDRVVAGELLALIQNDRASALEVRRLETDLAAARSRRAELAHRLGHQTQLIARLQRDWRAQRQLEADRYRSEIRRVQADIGRAEAELAFAQRDVARQDFLFRSGAIAETIVDRARTTARQRQQDLDNLNSQLRGQQTLLEAARRDLTLTTTRSNFDPVSRLQEAQLLQESLRDQLRTATQEVEGLQRQVKVARRQFRLQADTELRSPDAAVVWQNQARPGDRLQADQVVMQLINCRQRWIDTFVSESDLNNLRIGSPATIQLVGNRIELRGRVAFIRSGVGRLQLGQDDPTPIPINLARESQVRVELLEDAPAPPLQFCYVGYTARVLFER